MEYFAISLCRRGYTYADADWRKRSDGSIYYVGRIHGAYIALGADQLIYAYHRHGNEPGERR
jgi:hypothetical protein